jgi:hypothetical protein
MNTFLGVRRLFQPSIMIEIEATRLLDRADILGWRTVVSGRL